MKTIRIYELTNDCITRSVKINLASVRTLKFDIFINVIRNREILVAYPKTFEGLITFAEEVKVYDKPISFDLPHVALPHEWLEPKPKPQGIYRHAIMSGLICLIG